MGKCLQSDNKECEGVLEGWNDFVDLLDEADHAVDKEKLKQIGYERLVSSVEESQTSL